MGMYLVQEIGSRFIVGIAKDKFMATLKNVSTVEQFCRAMKNNNRMQVTVKRRLHLMLNIIFQGGYRK